MFGGALRGMARHSPAGGALRAGVAFATSAELHTPPDTLSSSLVFAKGGGLEWN